MDFVNLCDSDDEEMPPSLAVAGPSHQSNWNQQQQQNNNVIEILDSDSDDDEIPKKKPCLSVPENHRQLDEISDETKADIQPALNEILSKSKTSNFDFSGSFARLRQILEVSPRNSPDYTALRSFVVESGVWQIIFHQLSVRTHHISEPIHEDPTEQPQTQASTSRGRGRGRGRGRAPRWTQKQQTAGNKSNGTGYGSGACSSTWNASKTLAKQAEEDRQVEVILQVLASFMNPNDDIPGAESPELPGTFIDLLDHSCLLPVLRSYMRNDSIMDMTNRVSLYRAVMLTIRAIAACDQIVHYLKLMQDDNDLAITDLLENIKTSANAYAGRIR